MGLIEFIGIGVIISGDDFQDFLDENKLREIKNKDRVGYQGMFRRDSPDALVRYIAGLGANEVVGVQPESLDDPERAYELIKLGYSEDHLPHPGKLFIGKEISQLFEKSHSSEIDLNEILPILEKVRRDIPKARVFVYRNDRYD